MGQNVRRGTHERNAAHTPPPSRDRSRSGISLLSPAGRPVQITSDLENFWTNTYREVKKDLMGRYPKHHWPDDPLAAMPTSRAKPRKR
ncbi:MAG: ATP-dependent helicase C-terminal domain-containing protein [Desulfobacteraceae bacterium]